MTQFAIKSKYEIDAAWTVVHPWLETLTRGDEVLRDEIKRLAPTLDPQRLDARVRGYLRKKFGGWISLTNRGWRIPLDGENTMICGTDYGKRSAKWSARQYRANVMANPANQSPVEQRLREAQIRHASATVALASKATKEQRAILGAPPPRPQLKPV